MYTGMLDVPTRNKNMKVPEPKLTETCSIAESRLISCGMNMF